MSCRSQRQLPAALPWLLAALPLLVYSFFIFWFSSDGPLAEEHDVLAFLMAWQDADSWRERYLALVAPATDHKPITTYLTALALLHLEGHLDFVHLGYLVNVAVLILLLTTLYPFRNSLHKPWLVFIASCFGFQLIPLGNMYWPGAGLADTLALLFALLALLALCCQTVVSTLLAVVFAAISIYSLGNGMIVLPAALLLLFCTGTPGKLRFNLLVRQLLLFEAVGMAAAFFYHADNPPALSYSLYVVEGSAASFLWNFLRLLGGGYSYSHEMLQGVIGIMIVALCLDLFRRGYHKQQPALAAYVAFLAGTILVLCLYRNWTLLDPHANRSRYYFVGMQIVIVLLLCYADIYLLRLRDSGLGIFLAVMAVPVLLFLISYSLHFWETATLCYNKKTYSQLQVIKVTGSNPVVETRYDALLQQAIARGHFRSEKLFSERPPHFLPPLVACYTGLEYP